MSKEGDDFDNRSNSEESMGLWGILIVGLIGASATTFAVKTTQLRRTTDWIYSQLSRYQSAWKNWRFSQTDFQEEARRRHFRRMQEEYEDEMERLERIRRMQNVFHRERNKHKKSYESWQQNGPTGYHQHSQRNDWYWDANSSNKYQETPPKPQPAAPLSHHYSILGLDRMRTQPYTDEEIKSAFRSKAKQFHPDQNQDNKQFAEAKFKEVMVSYNAIKSERKNNKRTQ